MYKSNNLYTFICFIVNITKFIAYATNKILTVLQIYYFNNKIHTQH